MEIEKKSAVTGIMLETARGGANNFVKWKQDMKMRFSNPSTTTSAHYWKLFETPFIELKSAHERVLEGTKNAALRREESTAYMALKTAGRTIWNNLVESIEPGLKSRVEEHPEFLEIRENSDGMDVKSLLVFLAKVSMGESTLDRGEGVLNVMSSILGMKLLPEESLEQYCIRFKSLNETLAALNPYGVLLASEELGEGEIGKRGGKVGRGPVPTAGYPIPEQMAVRILLRGLSEEYDAFKDRFGDTPSKCGTGYSPLPETINALMDNARLFRSRLKTPEAKAEVLITEARGAANRKKKRRREREDGEKTSGESREQRVKCYICDQLGHKARYCPQRSNPEKEKEESKKGKIEKENFYTTARGVWDSDEEDWRGSVFVQVTEMRGVQAIEAGEDLRVRLDTCAQVSIIRNINLVCGIKRADVRMDITTNTDTVPVVFTHSGWIEIGGIRHRVLVNPKATANIISYRNFERDALGDGCTIVQCRQRGKVAFQVVERDTGRIRADFTWGDDMPTAELTRKVSVFQQIMSHEGFTKEQLEKARDARTLNRRLGYMSTDAFARLLNREGIITKVQGKHARWALDAYGPEVPALKGRSTHKVSKIIRPYDRHEPAVVEQTLHADVFHTGGQSFLFTVSYPMNYFMVEDLLKGDMAHRNIRDNLDRMKGIYLDRGHVIVGVHYDDAAREGELSKIPDLTVHPAGQHVGRAERGIRTLKDQLRTMVQARGDLPWTGIFLQEAVRTAAIYCNLRHSKAVVHSLTPLTQMMGRVPQADRDFPARFGSQVLVESLPGTTKKSLIEQPRMTEAVWLRPALDDHGSSWVWLVKSKELAKRVEVKEVLMSKETLEALTKWAGGTKPDKKVSFKVRDVDWDLRTVGPDALGEFPVSVVPVPEGELIATRMTTPAESSRELHAQRAAESEGKVSPQTEQLVVSEPVGRESSSSGSARCEVEESHSLSGVQEVGGLEKPSPSGQIPRESAETRVHNLPIRGVIAVQDDADMSVGVGRIAPQGPRDKADTLVTEIVDKRYPGRIRVMNAKYVQVTGVEVVTHVIAKSVKQVNELPEPDRKEARRACMMEIENLTSEHQCLVAASPEEVNWGRDEVLPSSIFVEKKYANGMYTKTKARLVAGGHKQNKSEFTELSAQTVNTESVFLLLALSAGNKRYLAVIDVKGAYLNAKMETPRGGSTFIRVPRELAELFVLIVPGADVKRSNDGTLLLRVLMALYGCVQSSYLWQRKLTSVLTGMGFQISQYDICVAFHKESGVILAFHVDDIIVSAPSAKTRDAFIKDFKSIFEVTVHTERELDYLGIHISVGNDGIILSQHSMVDKLVEGVEGKSTSPMEVRDMETVTEAMGVPLNQDEAAIYRSKVASCLYIAKRTRPDTLLAVNRLCRHAHNPTQQDELDLMRLLRYMSHTRRMVLMLRSGPCKLQAYIDASFAKESDRKSTTGAVIFLGGAVLWATSAKQGVVSKSSTEAELIALSDILSMVLWISLFLQELGFGGDIPVVHQDNQSGIRIATKGFSNNINMRHVDIRKMWIKQFIDEKKIALSYTKTEDMVADGMTKPLTGANFVRFVRSLGMFIKSGKFQDSE